MTLSQSKTIIPKLVLVNEKEIPISKKIYRDVQTIEHSIEALGLVVRAVDYDIDNKNGKVHLYFQRAIGYRLKEILELKEDIAYALAIDPKQLIFKPCYDRKLISISIPLTRYVKVSNGDQKVKRPFFNPLAEISHNLKEIQTEGGDNNFVIFELTPSNNYFIQVRGKKGDKKLYLEAVSNKYLNKKHQLSKERIARLKRLGWKEPEAEGERSYHFFMDTSTKNDQERLSLACLIMQTFIDVYKYDLHQTISSKLVLQSLPERSIVKTMQNKIGKFTRISKVLLQELKEKVDTIEENTGNI